MLERTETNFVLDPFRNLFYIFKYIYIYKCVDRLKFLDFTMHIQMTFGANHEIES